MYSPLWKSLRKKSHWFYVLPPLKITQKKKPSVLCTPPFENHSEKKAIGFLYSPLWKMIHQKKAIGFMYSPLWKLTHKKSHWFYVLPPLKNQFFWEWLADSRWDVQYYSRWHSRDKTISEAFFSGYLSVGYRSPWPRSPESGTALFDNPSEGTLALSGALFCIEWCFRIKI